MKTSAMIRYGSLDTKGPNRKDKVFYIVFETEEEAQEMVNLLEELRERKAKGLTERDLPKKAESKISDEQFTRDGIVQFMNSFGAFNDPKMSKFGRDTFERMNWLIARIDVLEKSISENVKTKRCKTCGGTGFDPNRSTCRTHYVPDVPCPDCRQKGYEYTRRRLS